MDTDTRPTTPVDPAPATAPPPLGDAVGRAVMIVVAVLLAGGAVIGGLFVWSHAAATTEDTVTAHADVDRLLFDLGAPGDVEVRVHDRDEVVVAERIRTTLTRLEGDQRVVDGTLTVTTPRCGPWLNLLPANRCSASYVVTLPDSTAVAGTVGHGRMTVAGLSAPVSLRSGHGDVTVTEVAGDVTMHTGHGEVALTAVTGTVAVDTGHGRLTLVDVDGTVDASTGHGRVVLQGGRMDLMLATSHGTVDVDGTAITTAAVTSGHGGVRIAPSTAPTDLRIDTGHGAVTVTLPAGAPAYAVTTETSHRTDVTIATDPGADHRMAIRTGHGAIEVAQR